VPSEDDATSDLLRAHQSDSSLPNATGSLQKGSTWLTPEALVRASTHERVRSRGRFALIWIAAIALYAITMAITPAFVSFGEVRSILQTTSFLGFAAIGETFVMLVGGIDISVAGTITLAGIIAATTMNGQPNRAILGIVITIAIGMLIGLINGALVTIGRIQPLIATLAMGTVLGGAALIYSGGAPRGAISNNLLFLGQGHVGPIPVPALLCLAVGLLATGLLRGTTWGHRVYAIGANLRAATVLGIRTRPIIISCYVASAVLASISGLLLTAYIGTPDINAGDNYLLAPIAAAAVGGTLITGGVGSIAGTLGGALFLTILETLTLVLGMTNAIGLVVQGVIIVIAVSLFASQISLRRLLRRATRGDQKVAEMLGQPIGERK
jgi:ribose/xylose/arabinose/galactoside ABC-type transport system permease subunit